ncbi:hypothetical protein [Plantactinospora sp. GCM10030261]|uniref:hypothetical protein n=1 Tax=Plantactinospora sp. GCM10030261 TaxID=3273420 RepID=UPI00360E2D9B
MTIFGWDTSDYDVGRGLTPDRVRAAAGLGIQFLTAKGTEHSPGGVVRHTSGGWVLGTGRDAGIPFLGLYVVVRTGVSPAVQAQTLIEHATRVAPWWSTSPQFFWQVDLERWPYDDVAATVGVQVCAELEARTTKRVVLYASRGQYGDSQLGPYPRWNARYPYNRDEDFRAAYTRAGGDTGSGWQVYGAPPKLPLIWQYTSTARIGAQRTCDANAFRGDLTAFAVMIGATSPGGTDVKTTHIVTRNSSATVPVDGVYHDIPWSDGNVAYQVTGAGVVSHQTKLDLRGLRLGDLVRIRASYRFPGRTDPYHQTLSQQTVSVDPAGTGGIFLVSSANENHQLTAGTQISFAVAVTPAAGTGTRTVSYGEYTRKTILLYA